MPTLQLRASPEGLTVNCEHDRKGTVLWRCLFLCPLSSCMIGSKTKAIA